MEDYIIQTYTKVTMKGDRPTTNIFNFGHTFTKMQQPAASETSIHSGSEPFDDGSPRKKNEKRPMEPKGSSSVSLINENIRLKAEICQLKLQMFASSKKTQSVKEEGEKMKFEQHFASFQGRLQEIGKRMTALQDRNSSLQTELMESKRKITQLAQEGVQSREKLFHLTNIFNQFLQRPGKLGQHEHKQFQSSYRGKIIAAHFRDEAAFKQQLRQKMRRFGV